MENRGLVAVAMSGGVDSSVAAALLVRQGYQVVGLTMKLWDAGRSGMLNEKTCCTLDSSLDAKRVCDQLGIPHFTLDMAEEFENKVVEPFYQGFMSGETPNPCVNCNSFVKWDALWAHAKAVGATWMATGHYAETQMVNGRRRIARGRDRAKDQSYFLWGIPHEALDATLFPLEDLTKEEVREIAAGLDLRTAHKPESQDICFIPDGDKNRFLRQRAEAKGDTFAAGSIVGPEGKVLGAHEGLPFYTIGQRKGLGVAAGEPLFVQKLDRASNTLLLGRKSDLESSSALVEKCNWFDVIQPGHECQVQIRYRSRPLNARLWPEEQGLRIEFLDSASGITPGQSAVFYDGDLVLGGGIIGR